MLQLQPFLDLVAPMGEDTVGFPQHHGGQSHRLCHPVENNCFHFFVK